MATLAEEPGSRAGPRSAVPSDGGMHAVILTHFRSPGWRENGPGVVDGTKETKAPPHPAKGDTAKPHLELPRLDLSLRRRSAGARGARGVTDFVSLHRLLRRTFLLSRTLPDELWKMFAEKAAGLPRGTEAERLVVVRIGQDVFRKGLLDYGEGRCAITGLAVPELLRASHIKPWAECGRDEDRLDVYNVVLLSATLDAAFDGGFISVADDGTVLVSDVLDAEARVLLGLGQPMKVRGIVEGHRRYLSWHRGKIFKM